MRSPPGPAANGVSALERLYETPDGWLLLEDPPNAEAIPERPMQMPKYPSAAPSRWQERKPPQDGPHARLTAYFKAIRGESQRERDLAVAQREE